MRNFTRLQRVKIFGAVRLAALVIRLLGLTVRWDGRNDDRFHEWNKQGMILAFWHSAILGMLYHFRGSGIAMMISQSLDGEIIAGTAERFRHRAIRGSSSRGGREALRGMIRVLTEGGSVGFTPDGPRGPAYLLQGGAVLLARQTGRPIVSAAVAYDRFWRIGSRWDAFHIPKPFARAIVMVDDPFFVAPNDDAEEKRRALEELMRDQLKNGWAHFGRTMIFDDKGEAESCTASS